MTEDGPLFKVQAWTRTPGGWEMECEICETYSKEGVGVALATLTEDGEFHDGRKAAVWDAVNERYLGGPPW